MERRKLGNLENSGSFLPADPSEVTDVAGGTGLGIRSYV